MFDVTAVLQKGFYLTGIGTLCGMHRSIRRWMIAMWRITE